MTDIQIENIGGAPGNVVIRIDDDVFARIRVRLFDKWQRERARREVAQKSLLRIRDLIDEAMCHVSLHEQIREECELGLKGARCT